MKQAITPRSGGGTGSGLLTAAEAAAWLGVSPFYLCRMRTAGVGPKFVAIGRRRLYRVQDLEAFAARSVVATSNRVGV